MSAAMSPAMPSGPVAEPRRGDPLLAEQRRLALTGAAAILLAFGALLGWGATAPIGGAVIVTGQVAIDSERKTVQHLEGGIVKAILVKPGSIVKRGEPVILLEEVQADATVSALRKQLYADLARVARLEAERGGASGFVLPRELADRAGDPEVQRVVEPERKLFETRRRVLAEQVAMLRAESRQIGYELNSLASQAGASEAAMDALGEQLAIHERLRAENFVSNARVLELKGQHAERTAKRDESRAQMAQARQKMAQNEIKVSALQQAYVREATDELREAERRVNELRERLRPSQDALTRLSIVAPIDGEVVDLRVHTVGGVITPREPLMDIVPAGAPRVVKGRLRIDDITHVQPGAEVAIQLVAYKRRTTPVVAGRLAYVSADALVEQTPAGPLSYYEVRITVERPALQEAGDLEMTPGMPVEAYVKTGDRTLLEYLAQPIVQSMGRAFREY